MKSKALLVATHDRLIYRNTYYASRHLWNIAAYIFVISTNILADFFMPLCSFAITGNNDTVNEVQDFFSFMTPATLLEMRKTKLPY